MSVLLPCFNAKPDIFAVMNRCVVALNLFASYILTWSADSLQNKGSACRRICKLCQQTSPKRWFGNIYMTSNCDVRNSCNVRRIVACLCLPVALALRFSLIVLIAVTRPRVIDGPRFLCNSAYLGECCFFRVIGTLKCVSIRIEDWEVVLEFRKTYRSLQHKADIA